MISYLHSTPRSLRIARWLVNLEAVALFGAGIVDLGHDRLAMGLGDWMLAVGMVITANSLSRFSRRDQIIAAVVQVLAAASLVGEFDNFGVIRVALIVAVLYFTLVSPSTNRMLAARSRAAPQGDDGAKVLPQTLEEATGLAGLAYDDDVRGSAVELTATVRQAEIAELYSDADRVMPPLPARCVAGLVLFALYGGVGLVVLVADLVRQGRGFTVAAVASIIFEFSLLAGVVAAGLRIRQALWLLSITSLITAVFWAVIEVLILRGSWAITDHLGTWENVVAVLPFLALGGYGVYVFALDPHMVDSSRRADLIRNRADERSATVTPARAESAAAERDVLLSIRGLTKNFPVVGGFFGKEVASVQAVTDFSVEIARGETLGLVGESGCGKTTVGRLMLRLVEPTAGRLIFDGRDLRDLSFDEMKAARRRMQIIFQDPYASLNPRLPVGDIVGEGLFNAGMRSHAEREKVVADMLERVGLRKYYINRYPHEFSGGQRQRIGIARALVLQPAFVVADEPVSALDVSIQSQVLNLLKDLQDEFKLTYVFISHNLQVVEHVSDRVGVMYLGKLVELASATELYRNPKHPYTQALLSAIPLADPTRRRERILIKGDVPSAINPPTGCRFHTRCPIAQPICAEQDPVFEPKGGDPRHLAACHFSDTSVVESLAAKAAV